MLKKIRKKKRAPMIHIGMRIEPRLLKSITAEAKRGKMTVSQAIRLRLWDAEVERKGFIGALGIRTPKMVDEVSDPEAARQSFDRLMKGGPGHESATKSGVAP